VRTSNVVSGKKLPLLVHGKPITDQKDEDNVEAEHRLQIDNKLMPWKYGANTRLKSAVGS